MLLHIGPILIGKCELAPLVQMRLEQSAFFYRRSRFPDHLPHREFRRVFGRKDEHFLQPFEVVFNGHGCVPSGPPFIARGCAFPRAQLAIQLPQFADYLPWVIGRLVYVRADASTSDFPVC